MTEKKDTLEQKIATEAIKGDASIVSNNSSSGTYNAPAIKLNSGSYHQYKKYDEEYKGAITAAPTSNPSVASTASKDSIKRNQDELSNNIVGLVVTIDRLNQKIKEIETDAAEKIQKIESSFSDKLDGKRDEIIASVKKQTDETKSSILSSIALFVGFFAFLSINITVYSKAESVYQALLVLFSSLLCILFFVYGTIFIVKHEKILHGLNKTMIISTLIISLILSICNFIYSVYIRNEVKTLNSSQEYFRWVGSVPNINEISCCEKIANKY